MIYEWTLKIIKIRGAEETSFKIVMLLVILVPATSDPMRISLYYYHYYY